MRAQPPASHWIAGAAFDDPAGGPAASATQRPARTIARLHLATPTVIDRAIDAARDGFAAWSATPPAGRARVLRRAADLIRARNRELSELETLDTGKPLSETLVADWASGADALEWFAAPRRHPLGRGHRPRRRLRPDPPRAPRRLLRHRRLELPLPDRLLEGRARRSPAATR